jgi:hypothetical protein
MSQVPIIVSEKPQKKQQISLLSYLHSEKKSAPSSQEISTDQKCSEAPLLHTVFQSPNDVAIIPFLGVWEESKDDDIQFLQAPLFLSPEESANMNCATEGAEVFDQVGVEVDAGEKENCDSDLLFSNEELEENRMEL